MVCDVRGYVHVCICACIIIYVYVYVCLRVFDVRVSPQGDDRLGSTGLTVAFWPRYRKPERNGGYFLER